MRPFAAPVRVFAPHRIVVLAVALAACNPIGDLLGPPGSCLISCPGSPSVDFAVDPATANILTGDTISFYAWKCPEDRCFLMRGAPAHWTIRGEAVAATRPMVAPDSLLPLRAIAPGESEITAVSAENNRSERVTIVVADSTAVIALTLGTCCSGRDTILTYGDVLATLRDDSGRSYRAAPTEWSVSDSTIVALGSRSRFGAGAREVRVKRAGVVEIRARFRDVEGRVSIVARP